MRVINNIIKVKVEKDKFIYFNTLNGAADLIDEDVHNLISNWNESGIKCSKPEHEDIFHFLQQRNYIMEKDQEKVLKNKVYSKLRDIHMSRCEKTEHITLIVTYNCNFRCQYCFESLEKKDSYLLNKTITKEMVNVIYENYHKTLKTVQLFGGEPFLLNNYDIIDYILKKMNDVKFSVTTNGYFLEEFVPLIKNYDFYKVEVTLDGFEDYHNKKRFLANGQGTYKKILRGIESALSNNIPVSIRMNLDNNNLTESLDLCKMLMSKFENNKNLSFFRNVIFGDKNICRHEVMKDMLYQQEFISEDINKSLDSLHPIFNLFKENGRWNPKYIFCNAQGGHLIFDPHGKVYTCALAAGKESLDIGSYYPEFSINNNWLNRTVESSTNCSQCEKALFCGGGCTLSAITKEGELMQGDCELANTLINQIIPVLYHACLKHKLKK